MKRGFVFTLDALLALVLVSLVMVSAVAVTENSSTLYATKLQAENKQLAEGILQTLRTVPLDQLVSPSLVNNWISNGTLNLTYVNPEMPPLQIAATYWALSSKHPEFRDYASQILGEVLRNLADGYKYQLIINNYTDPFLTFDNSYENASDVGTAAMIVSGYLFNQTPRGYVAKAYLTKLVTQQEKLVGIQRVLAGGVYCTNLQQDGYDYESYPLSVSSLFLQYQTQSDDSSKVSTGKFQLNGHYSGGGVNLDIDLNGWSITYTVSLRSGYVTSVTLYGNGEILKLYLSHVSDNGNTETYRVTEILFEYPNGNYLDISLSYGVYLEVTWDRGWFGWYISSSRAYTTTPQISGAVYNKAVPKYVCVDSDYNSLNINFHVNLPNDAKVLDGLWHATQRGSYEKINVSINGNSLSNPFNQNIASFVTGGSNNIITQFQSFGDDEIGFGSGSWISLRYKTSTPRVEDPGMVKLYNVTSEGTGIYYLNSLFVPGVIKGINITLTVRGVHEIRVYYSNGTALNLIYENTSLDGSYQTVHIPSSTLINNLTKYTTLEKLSKKSFNLVLMLDAKYDPTENRPVRYAGQDYHLEWNNERVLYGYPQSWIKISYIPTTTTNRFYIPIERTYELESTSSTDVSTEMHFSYYLPENATPWYVDIWTAITFWDYPSGMTTVYEGPEQKEFLKFPLDLYLIRLAYTNITDYIMVRGATNRFKIESDNSDYTFRYNDSRAIVHYFLNGYAPYGNVFTYYSQNNSCGYNLTYWYNITGSPEKGNVIIGNCPPSKKPMPVDASKLEPSKYALDDAIVRLLLQLGASGNLVKEGYLPGTRENPIRIEMKQLAVKAIGIRNVPTSLSPIQVTLRIWRGS